MSCNTPLIFDLCRCLCLSLSLNPHNSNHNTRIKLHRSLHQQIVMYVQCSINAHTMYILFPYECTLNAHFNVHWFFATLHLKYWLMYIWCALRGGTLMYFLMHSSCTHDLPTIQCYVQCTLYFFRCMFNANWKYIKCTSSAITNVI